MSILSWLRNKRLHALRRNLAVVDAQLAQERAYLPSVYPVAMDLLIRQRAELVFDIDALEKRMEGK